MVGRAGSTTGVVHADVTLTRSKVKVTGLLNFQKLAKPCMHAGGNDRQSPSRAFWFLPLFSWCFKYDNKWALSEIYVKKLISLKHCVRSQITRLKLQKSFCDLEHGASL